MDSFIYNFEFSLNSVILAVVVGTLCGLAAAYLQNQGFKPDVAKWGAFCGKWGVRLGFIYLGYVFVHFINKYW